MNADIARFRLCPLHGLAFVVVAGLFATVPPLLEPAAFAATAPMAKLRTITRVSEAHDLSSQEAARAYPVHFRGVVTYVDATESGAYFGMFIHDDTGSIFVRVKRGPLDSLTPGTLIDLRGVTDPGEFAPTIFKSEVKVIGKSQLPANPGRPSLARMLAGLEDGKWVEVEGVVHEAVVDRDHAYLQLAMEDGSIPILTVREPGADYSRLVDAKVRIRGNAAPLFNSNRHQMIGAHILCPNLSAVEVLQPPPEDPFKLATIPVYKLLEWDVAPLRANRVHVQGRVTLQWPGLTVCLRDAPQGICAQTDQTTPLRNGELIDIAGFASAHGNVAVLTDAVFRSAGSGMPVPVRPLPVTAEQALTGAYDSQLVQIDGQLVSRDLVAADTTLLISSGGSIFKAILPRGMGAPETTAWKDGSILRIAGICSAQLDVEKSAQGFGTAVPKAFQILMRSPADVVVLQKPSWWTPVHAVLLLALALIVTLAVLAWVVVLRRRIRESEERFRYMAQHDALTGLATRLVLHDRLTVALEAARRHHNGLALLMLDIDRFKSINDTRGHHAGDEVLRVTAERIVQSVRKSDTVARMGGDEFVVLLPDLIDPRAAENVAAKLVAMLSAPISFGGRELAVSVSVGVCTAAPGELDPDVLLRNADTALYLAKAKGKNCFEVFLIGMAEA
jgi:diguanylate cyclase (GGDEF)-like protein